jgi:hypothetical protein
MNEVLSHDIKLLGLVMPDNEEFCSYFTELPVHFKKCENFRELYRLKKRKKLDTKDNIEIFEGLDVLIHVESENRYYYRTLKHYSNMNNHLKFFKDGNLYILKDDLRQKDEPEPDEIIETTNVIIPETNEDKSELIF